MASDILSYNVVQNHEGISIKGYRGLRPQGDLIYSDLSVLKPWICMFRHWICIYSCTNLKVFSCKTYMIIRNFKRKLVAASTYPFKWGFDQFPLGEPNGTSDIS